MTDQTNMRLPDRTRNQISDLRNQIGMNITDTTIKAIDELWRAEFKFGFNRAVKELSINYDRQAFARYWQRVRDSKDDVYEYDMWKVIYRGFEYSYDYQDWLTTQQDALS